MPTVTPLLGLPGLNFNDGGSSEPPDAIVASGPGQVVELVNAAMTVIDKTSGARLSTQSLSSFFPVQSGDSLSDPFVTYDDLAGRFFVGVLESDPTTQKSYYDFAVSDGADATGGFTEKQQVDVSESANEQALMAEFPRVGWDHDAYVVSFNEYAVTDHSFARVQVLSIDKDSVLDRNNSTLVDYRLDRDGTNFTMVPAVMHGAAAAAPIWFVEEGTTANTLRFVSMSTVPGRTPSFTDYAQVPVAAYSEPPGAAQPGGGTIATNDSRILSVAWRDNAMVAAQTVGTGGAAHARWYDFNTSGASPSLSQWGEIAPAGGASTYFPAIEIAADGDLGMAYMESSATEYLSVYVTGRTASDPAGTMETSVLAQAGTAAYTGSGAGDYSGIGVDPNPGLQSFWAASPYSPGSPLWGTWVQNFSIGGEWSSYNQNPQHTGLAQVASQPIDSLHWSTPVDLDPQYSGNDLYIHYGSPVVTPGNTVIIPVKTGASGGFQLQARSGSSGAMKWVHQTDYALPPGGYDWTPSYSPTLSSSGSLYFPGLGGTVYRIDSPDSGVGTVTQLAFYGTYTHAADSTVFINTPITADAAGDIFFGFQTFGAAPGGLTSGIARIDADGNGTWAAASTISGNGNIIQVVDNAAPALSNDGRTLYVPVSNGNFGYGYLVALDSTTLAFKSEVVLVDPSSGQVALLPNDGSASPTVGPDGDVYFGVLENPFPGHHDRGWLLHYSADLSVVKTPGSFGWDDTASIVPARLVPSYTGTSTYLVMTKYNDYADVNGTGVNKIAILDPNAQQSDLVLPGTQVMKEVLTIAGVTPDPNFPNTPGAVREWCINAAAVDPVTDSVIVNSEDGRLYRWDLSTNTFTQSITLEAATGEAYTPTFIGPDGTVYAINDAVLHAVGKVLSPPTLAPIADQTVGPNPATLTITLNGSDPDGYALTYSATAETLPYALNQAYGFYEDGGGYFLNYRGQQEKYLHGAISSQGYDTLGVGPWYYLLPNGDLYEQDPSSYGSTSLFGAFVASLGPAVYNDPSLLWNAQNTPVPVALTVSGNQLTIAPNSGYSGTFVATATVDDGHGGTASRSFRVTVTATNQPPTLAPIADQTMGPNPATLTITLNGSDPNGYPLTYSATAQSLPYALNQAYGFSEDGGGYYLNYRGQQEKYLHGAISSQGYNTLGIGPWYYLLPNGDLYEQDPSSYGSTTLTGAFVASLGPAVYNDPSLLWNAQNTRVPVTLTVSGNQLMIAPDSGFLGTFVIFVTVDDGHGGTASRSFKVTVH